MTPLQVGDYVQHTWNHNEFGFGKVLSLTPEWSYNEHPGCEVRWQCGYVAIYCRDVLWALNEEESVLAALALM